MNDRELLELAARAAGMNIQRSRLDDPLHRDFLMNGEEVRNPGQCSFPWNPLTDDGDALRLAVKLNLTVSVCGEFTKVSYGWGEGIIEYSNESKDAATCRAIVRAAAIMGEMLCRL